MKAGHIHYVEYGSGISDDRSEIFFEANQFNVGKPNKEGERKLIRSGKVLTHTIAEGLFEDHWRDLVIKIL